MNQLVFKTTISKHTLALATLVKLNMTKLQIVSDTHIEFRKQLPTIPRLADHIALLGDIGNPRVRSYEIFIGNMSKEFETVFVVLGNHEYYTSNSKWHMKTIKQRIDGIIAKYDNVHLLERLTFDLTDNTRLVGCTLWSNINEVGIRFLNDFRKIWVQKEHGKRLLTQFDYLSMHHRDVAWLQEAIAQCEKDGKQAVVLTHHGTSSLCAGKFLGSPYNPGFVTELPFIFKSPVVASASGHVHSNVDTMINGVRVVSNALGYPGEHDVGYKEDVCIDIS